MPWFSKCLNWLCKLEGTSVPATEKPIIWSKLRQNREIKIVALRLCLLGVFHFSFLHKLHNVYQFAISIHTAIRIQGKKWAIYICRQRSELKAYLYTHRQTEKKKKDYFVCKTGKFLPVYWHQQHREERTIFFCRGGRGAFWNTWWVAAKHLLFPRWDRNSEMQPGPKATTRGGHVRDKVCLCVGP